MYRGSGPRIAPLIAVIIVVALVIAALVTAGKMLFNGNKTTTNTDTGTTAIADAVRDTSDSRSVRWTVRGPIVADEKFRSYQITVSPSKRTYVTYSGYLDQVIDTKSYDNNARAYEEFIYALDNANVSATRNTTSTDFRGVCATQGIAYMFETLSGDAADHTLWSSTCKDSKGNLAAEALKLQALFVNQIPDFAPLFNSIY